MISPHYKYIVLIQAQNFTLTLYLSRQFESRSCVLATFFPFGVSSTFDKGAFCVFIQVLVYNIYIIYYIN